MPFIDLDTPAVQHRGMQLDNTWEQMAELVQGINAVGNDGLLMHAAPEGYWEGETWHWRIRMQPAHEGQPLGPELVGTPGMWVVIAVQGATIKQIMVLTDEERLARGLTIAA